MSKEEEAANLKKLEAEAEKTLAEAAKLRAEAEGAKPDPEKALADAEKTRAETAKALADARSAAAKAEADERAEQEARSASARQEREATAQKATQEANRDAAAARREQLAALVPDFGAVKDGTLSVEGEAPFAPALVQRAIGSAAAKVVADIVKAGISGDAKVLVTSEADLATSDAAYFEVIDGLVQLQGTATKLLDELSGKARTRTTGTPLDLVAVLAGALPGLLSLFAAKRSVKTAEAAVSDLAAGAATAGALKRERPGWTIVHDDVRLLKRGDVGAKLDALNGSRQELTGYKLQLEDAKTRKATQLVDKRAEEAKAKAHLEKAAEAEKEQAAKDLARISDEAEQMDLAVAAYALRIGLIDSVCAAIDTFTSELLKVPPGDTRSPLARAMLRQGLHGNPRQFDHVLLVKGAGGSTTQTVDDKPLFFKDQLSVLATVAITYVFLEAENSGILAAGSQAASVTMYGKLGEKFETSVENRVP
jgi:hypothetical protein